jgi:hypothetical protein
MIWINKDGVRRMRLVTFYRVIAKARRVTMESAGRAAVRAQRKEVQWLG